MAAQPPEFRVPDDCRPTHNPTKHIETDCDGVLTALLSRHDTIDESTITSIFEDLNNTVDGGIKTDWPGFETDLIDAAFVNRWLQYVQDRVRSGPVGGLEWEHARAKTVQMDESGPRVLVHDDGGETTDEFGPSVHPHPLFGVAFSPTQKSDVSPDIGGNIDGKYTSADWHLFAIAEGVFGAFPPPRFFVGASVSHSHSDDSDHARFYHFDRSGIVQSRPIRLDEPQPRTEFLVGIAVLALFYNPGQMGANQDFRANPDDDEGRMELRIRTGRREKIGSVGDATVVRKDGLFVRADGSTATPGHEGEGEVKALRFQRVVFQDRRICGPGMTIWLSDMTLRVREDGDGSGGGGGGDGGTVRDIDITVAVKETWPDMVRVRNGRFLELYGRVAGVPEVYHQELVSRPSSSSSDGDDSIDTTYGVIRKPWSRTSPSLSTAHAHQDRAHDRVVMFSHGIPLTEIDDMSTIINTIRFTAMGHSFLAKAGINITDVSPDTILFDPVCRKGYLTGLDAAIPARSVESSCPVFVGSTACRPVMTHRLGISSGGWYQVGEDGEGYPIVSDQVESFFWTVLAVARRIVRPGLWRDDPWDEVPDRDVFAMKEAILLGDGDVDSHGVVLKRGRRLAGGDTGDGDGGDADGQIEFCFDGPAACLNTGLARFLAVLRNRTKIEPADALDTSLVGTVRTGRILPAERRLYYAIDAAFEVMYVAALECEQRKREEREKQQQQRQEQEQQQQQEDDVEESAAN